MKEHNGRRNHKTFYTNDLQDSSEDCSEEAWFTFETEGAFHRFTCETSFGGRVARIWGGGKARINLLGPAQL